MKNNLTCQECKSGYYRPPSKIKNSKFCSAKCRNNNISKLKKIEREEAVCLKCQSTFTKRKDISTKYCSKACYLDNVKKEVVTKNCPNCGKDFSKSKNRITKYCGRTCLREAQSSGLQEIPSNGRMGFRRDLNPNYFFKSSLEADYARWCEATGKTYIYEHKTFTVQYEGKDKKYTPDFYHPDEDRYVETKAIRRDRKFNSNILAADLLKEQGINIDILLMDEFYRSIKQSGHYWLIDNIENKNYLGTRHLIYLKKSK